METSRVATVAEKANSTSNKKLLSDEWVADLFSVNSDVTDTEHDCYTTSSEEIKNAIEIHQTNDKQLDEKHCQQAKAITDIETESPKNQNDCENQSNFVINKECYRDKSDSSESDSSSSVDPNSDSSTSSLDYIRKRIVPQVKNVVNKAEKKLKTRGELGLKDLPPIEELSISVLEKESELIGKVHSIVEQLVAVRSIKGLAPIDLDSVLFLSHCRPLGKVFDVFGPVTEPFYCIRFNNGEEIKAKLIEIGMDVFYAPRRSDMTKFVFVDELKVHKGSDASWKDNNEPPEQCLDYSNDEEERNAKKRRLKKRDCEDSSDADSVPTQVPVIKDPAPHPVQTKFETAPFFKGQYIAPMSQPAIAPHLQMVRPSSQVAFNYVPSPATLYRMNPGHQYGQISHPIMTTVHNPVTTPVSYPQWHFTQPRNFMTPNRVFMPPMVRPRSFNPTTVPPPHAPLARQVPPTHLRQMPPNHLRQMQPTSANLISYLRSPSLPANLVYPLQALHFQNNNIAAGTNRSHVCTSQQGSENAFNFQ